MKRLVPGTGSPPMPTQVSPDALMPEITQPPDTSACRDRRRCPPGPENPRTLGRRMKPMLHRRDCQQSRTSWGRGRMRDDGKVPSGPGCTGPTPSFPCTGMPLGPPATIKFQSASAARSPRFEPRAAGARSPSSAVAPVSRTGVGHRREHGGWALDVGLPALLRADAAHDVRCRTRVCAKPGREEPGPAVRVIPCTITFVSHFTGCSRDSGLRISTARLQRGGLHHRRFAHECRFRLVAGRNSPGTLFRVVQRRPGSRNRRFAIAP